MTTDAKFWDALAESYAAKPVADEAAFDRKKAITRAHLHPGLTVLELGCGTGSLALDLAAGARHIHAVDVSAAMIRIANDKKRAAGTENVTFYHGTLESLDLGPSSFGCVWAYSFLHLIDDRVGTLRRIFALLEPGGALIASHVCLGDGWIPYRPLLAVMRWLGKAPVVHVYDRATILRELREAGFVDVEEKDVGAERTIAFVIAKKPR
jgi:ubiquinone/menaquinone biosynthesis C-methylase UbiE